MSEPKQDEWRPRGLGALPNLISGWIAAGLSLFITLTLFSDASLATRMIVGIALAIGFGLIGLLVLTLLHRRRK